MLHDVSASACSWKLETVSRSNDGSQAEAAVRKFVMFLKFV